MRPKFFAQQESALKHSNQKYKYNPERDYAENRKGSNKHSADRDIGNEKKYSFTQQVADQLEIDNTVPLVQDEVDCPIFNPKPLTLTLGDFIK